jgi:hypothetical protein
MNQLPMDVDDASLFSAGTPGTNRTDPTNQLMDEILLGYLKKKGYQITKDEQQEQSSITLEKYAQQLGLSTESCTANHIVSNTTVVVSHRCNRSIKVVLFMGW